MLVYYAVMTTKEEKARRMEIRKKTGSRVIAPPPVRPRGPDYLIAHACFSCRVSFKKEISQAHYKCPNCGKSLNKMGRSFKAPKKTELDQWKKVETLWKAGFRFPTSSTEAPSYPKKFKDVADFIHQNPDHPYRVKD